MGIADTRKHQRAGYRPLLEAEAEAEAEAVTGEEFLATLGGVGGLSAAGLLALLLISFMRAMIKGDLLTRASVEDILEDRDYLREAFRKSQERNEAQIDQFEKLLESQETVVALAEALRRAARISEEGMGE